MSKQQVAVKPTTLQKWLFAVGAGTVFTAVSVGYLFLIGVSLQLLQTWSFIAAAVSSLLLASALSYGSIGYYTGWVNVRSGYQKQLGVLAFYIACVYCVTLLVLYPETYVTGFSKNIFSADVLLGMAAMSIFAAMVLVGTKTAAQRLSFPTIKFVLGLGYVGYALLVMRAIWIEWDVWALYLGAFDTPPPGRLLLSVVALCVLLLRVSIPVHKYFTKSN